MTSIFILWRLKTYHKFLRWRQKTFLKVYPSFRYIFYDSRLTKQFSHKCWRQWGAGPSSEALWGSRMPEGSAAAGDCVAFSRCRLYLPQSLLGLPDTLDWWRLCSRHTSARKLHWLSEGPSAGLPDGDIILKLRGSTSGCRRSVRGSCLGGSFLTQESRKFLRLEE